MAIREIIFRGKRVDSGEWVYGGIIFGKRDDFTLICESVSIYDYYDVDRKTVGQFTGLYDKNGTKIFEGDVLIVDGDKYDVLFDEGTFYLHFLNGEPNECVYIYESIRGEVIGNVYEVTQ